MNKIRLQDLTPEIYYKQSRDFQFIGRLYDTVLNSVKTNTELLYSNPLSDNSNERLLDLMTLTLGFKSKHNYNVKQLAAMCSAFCYIMKNKGNIKSITTAVNVLLNAEGITDSASYELKNENKELVLHIPQALTDLNLLRDLLNYVLPAGMSCTIVSEMQINAAATTSLKTVDSLTTYNYVDIYDKSTFEQNLINEALAKDTAGLFMNSEVVLDEGEYSEEENSKHWGEQ